MSGFVNDSGMRDRQDLRTPEQKAIAAHNLQHSPASPADCVRAAGLNPFPSMDRDTMNSPETGLGVGGVVPVVPYEGPACDGLNTFKHVNPPGMPEVGKHAHVDAEHLWKPPVPCDCVDFGKVGEDFTFTQLFASPPGECGFEWPDSLVATGLSDGGIADCAYVREDIYRNGKQRSYWRGLFDGVCCALFLIGFILIAAYCVRR